MYFLENTLKILTKLWVHFFFKTYSLNSKIVFKMFPRERKVQHEEVRKRKKNWKLILNQLQNNIFFIQILLNKNVQIFISFFWAVVTFHCFNNKQICLLRKRNKQIKLNNDLIELIILQCSTDEAGFIVLHSTCHENWTRSTSPTERWKNCSTHIKLKSAYYHSFL